MASRPTALARTSLHRLLVIVGIVLMPVAVLARQFGITIPIHRAIERVEDPNDQTAD